MLVFDILIVMLLNMKRLSDQLITWYKDTSLRALSTAFDMSFVSNAILNRYQDIIIL